MMNQPPELFISLQGGEGFRLDETTFNPFVLGPQRVAIWTELVIRNTSEQTSSPPNVLFYFDKPVRLRCSSHWEYLTGQSKAFWDPGMGLEYAAIGQMNTAM